MKTLKICMTGFGNVGKRFCELLVEKQDYLQNNYGYHIVITGIATRSKGTLMNVNGLDLTKVLAMMNTLGKFDSSYEDYIVGDAFAMIEKSAGDVFLELSTLSMEDGEPATTYIKKAFERNMHVITANKGPEAWHYKELIGIAKSKNLQYLCETAVMGGTPVLNLVSETLHGAEIFGFRGILNATSNYVLCCLEKGLSYEQAIKQAQNIGLAEADPSIDMDGWDGASKICAMTNILMDCEINPKMVQVESLSHITKEDIEKAREEGYKIKYICEAKKDTATNTVSVIVSPQRLPMSDTFSNVNDTSSAVTFYTDLAGEITIITTNPTLLQTAYGVYSDLITLMKRIK